MTWREQTPKTIMSVEHGSVTIQKILRRISPTSGTNGKFPCTLTVAGKLLISCYNLKLSPLDVHAAPHFFEVLGLHFHQTTDGSTLSRLHAARFCAGCRRHPAQMEIFLVH